ncbi:hypothetical protein GA0070624_0192 [Micromonospora rhizosphaerae]|uniref:Uncharacterized protein n=1 Tax=Micromonospora rhizosphaerae TaxID=568872 RepID=A0A1C6R987_9ACTN|nr:hypothetical protein [Micromonospora rhizosphaerae]SCL13637.1 hypothetical protein GA0070624_0192 [Micromonospora rhizosphaerae]
MAEPDDALLGGEFSAYRETLLPAVHPAGPTAARETARRRRRRSAAAAAAVAVLTLTIPVVGWATIGRDQGRPPTPTGTLPPVPTDTESPTATATPMPSPTATGGAQRPISRADLLAATVDVPEWPAGAPCASGPTPLTDPPGRPGEVILSGFVGAYGDVDRDGVKEPVALIRCLVSKGSYPEQVVAFDRDAAGRVVVLGRIFRSDQEKPEWLYSLSVRPDGLVRVEVTDVVPVDGRVPDESHRQWRGFRWNGSDFVQTDGPLSFSPTSNAGGTGGAVTAPPRPSAPPVFAVLASNVVYGPRDAGGRRGGSTSVTFENTSRSAVEYPMVSYVANGDDQLAEALAQSCWNFFRNGNRITCLAQPVEAGGQGEVELPFTTVADGPDHELTVIVEAGQGETGSAVPGTATTLNVEVSFGG